MMNEPPPPKPLLPPPPSQQPQICPRCESSNTKFCYFNNYSLSQPRYHCKTCKRYWTLGGTLRNIPVGGGIRKVKRTSIRNSPSPSSSHTIPNYNQVGNNICGDLGSSFGLLQGFGLPFTTPQEQPRHLHQQQRGIVDNVMFQPNWASTSSQSVNPQGSHWSNSCSSNNNNSVGASNGMSSLNNPYQWSTTTDQNGGSGLPPLPQFSSYFSPPFK
ncbi:hypothetical protein GIB67_015644 [Kingdonia uniflora]|uniref:Dof zinc finger protein n=1 Tax=Kingdonia uniflora TaxID=39325 RepID=A0A7J7NUN7_9MAGN|nr:hypothetical protein GIB67_015644 [Kingdonia uniflora]